MFKHFTDFYDLKEEVLETVYDTLRTYNTYSPFYPGAIFWLERDEISFALKQYEVTFTIFVALAAT